MKENGDLNKYSKYRKGYLWNHKRATRCLATMHNVNRLCMEISFLMVKSRFVK